MITGAFSGNIQPTDSSAVVDKARVSVHDPSVLKDSNGTYYIFGSHIDAAKSNDLQNWYTFTNGYTPVNNKIFGNLSQNLSKAAVETPRRRLSGSLNFIIFPPFFLF